ncbi:MAG: hypothetical protein P4L42_00945 [Desulfocapsaceae bacterium]|nr:hypothetical protein [Desulfocapsaceae bacterium]
MANQIKFVSYVIGVTALVILLNFTSLYADDIGDLQKEELVNSIKSVNEVKEALKNALKSLDECGFGSCFDARTTQICELVGALDVRVNGKISDGMQLNQAEQYIDISENDLKLMKIIFKNCKATTYQYWKFDSILHVSYLPSTIDDQRIRKALKAKKKDSVPIH